MAENKANLNPQEIAFRAFQNNSGTIENGISRLPAKTIKTYSNRLPGKLVSIGTSGGFTAEKGVAGGLAAALKMALVLEEGYGRPQWAGWSGIIRESDDPEHVTLEEAGLTKALEALTHDEQYELNAIHLTQEDFNDYYLGYNNDRIWMLFHGFPEKSTYNWINPEEDDRQWEVNKRVNRRFAEHAAQNYQNGDRFWIHDYHLILQAKYMREIMPENHFVSSFFLHIPFPKTDNFMLLPQDQQKDLIEGFLSNSSVFFQTKEDLSNFIETAKLVLGVNALTINEDQNGNIQIGLNNRTVLVGAKPIGIDAESFGEKANQMKGEIDKEKAKFLRDAKGRKIAYSVARLDPSKGSPERIKAIDQILTVNPAVIEEEGLCLVEVVAPSRKGVRAYDDLSVEIQRETDRVNQKHGEGTVQLYNNGIHDFTVLAALMGCADLAVITPIRDGYNLVQDENARLKKPDSIAIYGKGAGATRGYEGMVIEVDGGDVSSVMFGMLRALEILRNEPQIAIDWDEKMKQHLLDHNVRTWARNIRKDGNL